jgi:AraC family transcriptional regulator
MNGKIYAESLTTALAAHLIRSYSVRKPLLREYKNGLPKYKLRRVVEFINENLESEITLAELAAVAELSVTHFARSFKQATGQAPHGFVILRRIERAKMLLSETDTPITEIALHVGCSDASHLSHLFRKFVGTSPAAFRKIQ